MKASRAIQTIAITGGKGGVGKSQLALNLALALTEAERRVLLVDADLGLANLHLLLGAEPKLTLAHVVAGKAKLKDTVLSLGDLRLVPGSCGMQPMTMMSPQQYAALIHSFSELQSQLDVMMLDTGPGISDSVVNFLSASREVVLVITGETASVAAAHALVKLASRRGVFRFRVVVNLVRNLQEAKQAFSRLTRLCEDSLDVALHYLGHIPFDENLRQASHKQKPLLHCAPRSRAAQAIRAVADKLAQLPPPAVPSGKLEFFVESLIEAAP